MDQFGLSVEYYKLVDIVLKFDSNLLLVKGWGVTFSFATLVLGFKEKARGLFLLAAISGLCFWVIEAEMKWHQSNYYYRMSDIEHICSSSPAKATCPKIDWSWNKARELSTPFADEVIGIEVGPKTPEARIRKYFMVHVWLPHIAVVFLGFFFFRKNSNL